MRRVSASAMRPPSLWLTKYRQRCIISEVLLPLLLWYQCCLWVLVSAAEGRGLTGVLCVCGDALLEVVYGSLETVGCSWSVILVWNVLLRRSAGGFLPVSQSPHPENVHCQRPVLLEVHCTDSSSHPSSFISHKKREKRTFITVASPHHTGHPPLPSFLAGCWTVSWAPPFTPILILSPPLSLLWFPSPLLPEIVLAALRRCSIWLQSSLRSSPWPFSRRLYLVRPQNFTETNCALSCGCVVRSKSFSQC